MFFINLLILTNWCSLSYEYSGKARRRATRLFASYEYKPLEFQSVHDHLNRQIGISSLLRVEDTVEGKDEIAHSVQHIIAGTKHGTLHELKFRKNGDAFFHTSTEIMPSPNEGTAFTATSKAPRKPLRLPIFSLAFDRVSKTVLAGGGDRYISLIKQASNRTWEALPKKLGPHTGWVKATIVLDKSQRNREAFSVGCNRIETWECSDNEEWIHAGTMSVGSSPTETGTCTLSSDLLCLAMCYRGSKSDRLAAGGVDGRIHFFSRSKKTNKMEEESSLVAHIGRVNALTYDNEFQLLFSASHDGTVKVWSQDDKPMASPLPAPVTSFASLYLGDGIRLTALSCWKEETDTDDRHAEGISDPSLIRVAVGTQTGRVFFLNLQQCGPERSLCLDKMVELPRNEPQKSPPIITSICPLQEVDSSAPAALVIGHSFGLGLIHQMNQIEGKV